MSNTTSAGEKPIKDAATEYLVKLRDVLGLDFSQPLELKDLFDQAQGSVFSTVHDIANKIEHVKRYPISVDVNGGRLPETKRRVIHDLSPPYRWLNADLIGAVVRALVAEYHFGERFGDTVEAFEEIGIHRQEGAEIVCVTEGELDFFVLDRDVESERFYFRRERVAKNQMIYVPAGLPHGVRMVSEGRVQIVVWMREERDFAPRKSDHRPSKKNGKVSKASKSLAQEISEWEGNQNQCLVAWLNLDRNLRKARHETGMSLSQVTYEVGFTNSLITRIESGDVFPKLDTIFRLRTALKTPLHNLITDHTRPYAVLKEGAEVVGDESRDPVPSDQISVSRILYPRVNQYQDGFAIYSVCLPEGSSACRSFPGDLLGSGIKFDEAYLLILDGIVKVTYTFEDDDRTARELLENHYHMSFDDSTEISIQSIGDTSAKAILVLWSAE